MRKSKKPYSSPKLTKKKIEINLFWKESRFFDSLIGMDGQFMAQCSLPCGCFLLGTKVTLSTNKKIEIEKVKHLDKVLSYDPLTATFIENQVNSLIIHPGEKTYYILNKQLYVTGNHRVWTNNLEWKRVDELRIGDTLLTSTAKPWSIESIERKMEVVTVYDLQLINSPHSFFANDLLVHNGSNGDTAEKMP